MANRPTFVIVGASLAGGRAAQVLRKEGFDGRLVLIGAEADPPYERPPLSKEYLRGESAREKLFIAPPAFYDENDIELRLGVTAKRVDTQGRIVELESGERIPFDALLLTTGGRPRALPVQGTELEGVYYLRDIGDSERIGAELDGGRRLVVVGAGFIGSEVAASAKRKNLEVTVLEVGPVPLERALGREVGGIFAEIHRDHGVELRTGQGVERFEGERRVERVIATGGEAVDCDLVVIGVGIEPNTEIAEGTAISVDNGIVVDEYCQTDVEGIFAAGDVANYYSPVLDQRLRVEHWENAQSQGRAAALNMLGRKEPYNNVPWFWSDQYDLNMQLVGHAASWDEVVFRGDVRERKFTAFYLKDGRLLAALSVNRFRDIRPSRKIVEAGLDIDARKLQDEDVDLRSLLPST